MNTKAITPDEYWQYLEEVYSPHLSNERARELLDVFLLFKSNTVSNLSGTPKSTEDAITHLQRKLDSARGNAQTSFLSHIIGHPIVSSVIAGIAVLIVWAYISKCFTK